jgi:hypothetical protein
MVGISKYFQLTFSDGKAVCSACGQSSEFVEMNTPFSNSKCLMIYIQHAADTRTQVIPATLNHDLLHKTYHLKAAVFDYPNSKCNTANHFNCVVTVREKWFFCNDEEVEQIEYDDFINHHLNSGSLRIIFYRSEE